MTDIFQQITAISTAIIGVSLVVLIVLIVVAVARTRAAGKRLEQMFQRTLDDLRPLIDRSKAISEDVSAMTHSIRGDVAAVSETVTAANERVRAALTATEERLAEFDALLSVVQSEAEDIFISTAAAVRGVGRGAASLGRRRGTNLASVEAEDAAAGGEIHDEEEGDGDAIDARPSEEVPEPAPRIRPRAPRPRAS
jgi:uncharacterized protein YoxC